ncbi:hypothetical protein Agub_g6794 [Astrephomene gubernaculifera]|uniref:Alpha-amylase n=1 Tax=Astrephomene gubernaculifera TaxID=47775 RepID=A0AAD3DP31_9CHLO|nr:hypothetical protein Agub_g6794 [Astrephomene gubernaculifera]
MRQKSMCQARGPKTRVIAWQRRSTCLTTVRAAVVSAAPEAERKAKSTGTVSHSNNTQQSPRGYEDAIMLQGFAWDSCLQNNWYGTVQSKIPDMQAAGISHVWLPPPSQSVSPQGYMPGQLYNLSSRYGNKEQLTALTQALGRAGMQALADIVINHRCADEMEGGVYNRFRDDVKHTGRRIDWGRWAITCNDPAFKGSGNPDTGDDFGPAPDLDHANPELRASLADWLGWLQREVGFAGWRLDFARGYAARYAGEYVAASTGPQQLNVGEVWVDLAWSGPDLQHNQDAARQRICDWIRGTGESCCAFDFPTKGLLQEAVKHTQYQRLRDGQGKAPGLLGWWPARSVSFIENHDTGSTQQHWPFPADKVAVGYAYILTHPGIPCIFWDHFASWGEELHRVITGLALLRRRAGIHAGSRLEVLAAEPDMYVARVGGSLTVKLGPRYDMGAGLLPREGEGWRLALSGRDWAVWERVGGSSSSGRQ